jgi:hypothetical protein
MARKSALRNRANMSADDLTHCDQYSRFLQVALEHLDRQQRRILRVLRDHRGFSLRTTGATLTLHLRGLPLLSSKVVFVGRHDSELRQWRWGWSEATADEDTSPLDDVRAVGEARGFQQLTREVWTARKDEAWQMASIATLVLDGRGVYRAQEGALSSYYVLLDPLTFESLPPPSECEW